MRGRGKLIIGAAVLVGLLLVAATWRARAPKGTPELILAATKPLPRFGGAKVDLPTIIPRAEDLTSIEVRVTDVKILDNGSYLFSWSLLPNFETNLYVFSMGIDSIGNKFQPIDPQPYPAKNGVTLPYKGLAYQWIDRDGKTESPTWVCVISTVIKSNEIIRDWGRTFEAIRGDKEFQGAESAIVKVLSGGPATEAIKQSARVIVDLITARLKAQPDERLITVVAPYTVPGGDFNRLGPQPPVRWYNAHAEMKLGLTVWDPQRAK